MLSLITEIKDGVVKDPYVRQSRLRSNYNVFGQNLPYVDLPPTGSYVPYHTDKYFSRAVATLKHDEYNPTVTMQVFTKKEGVVAGILENLWAFGNLPGVTFETLNEGDLISPWEPVMHITGRYQTIAEIETILLGVLARRSLVATNAYRCRQAANTTPVIFMGARHEDWRMQRADGYAVYVGGAMSGSTDMNGHWTGEKGLGTMPHALIAAYGGNTIEATLAYARYLKEHEPEEKVVSLVDYTNECAWTALEVCRAMREAGHGNPYAVRLDTSEKLQDFGLSEFDDGFGREKLTGVNPVLVRQVRKILDNNGFYGVRIFVSGGFTPAKIWKFMQEGVPVDGFGVGSSLLGHNRGEADGLLNSMDFTADIVKVSGMPESKVGRNFIENDRLIPFKVNDNG